MSQEELHVEEVTESKFDLINFYEDNKRNINIAAIVILLVVVGIWGYVKYYKPSQEAKANAELFMAERYFGQDSLDLALNGDGEYAGVLEIAENSGTLAGKRANFYAGRAYMAKGQFEDAIPYLKKADFDDQIVGPLTKCLIGDCYSEMEDYDNAASWYMKGAKQNSNDFSAPYCYRKAARCYEKTEDWAAALDVYKTLKSDYSKTQFGQNVEKYISRAETKLNK